MDITFRPPAVPLIAIDPYLSIWSFADKLTDDLTRHWTGTPQQMFGVLRIDGHCYRFCGNAQMGFPDLEVLEQTGLVVTPTRTRYTFANASVQLTLTFLTAALPHDLDALSRPLTYVLFELDVTDGKTHEVSLYWDVGGEIATDSFCDFLNWGRVQLPGLDVLRVAHANPRPLARSGDNLRIDWGNAYLSLASGKAQTFIGGRDQALEHFIHGGCLPEADSTEQPDAVRNTWVSMVASFDFGRIGDVGNHHAERHLSIAYDDGFSIEYMHQRLRPWWRRNGSDAAQLLAEAERDFSKVRSSCEAFDTRTMEQLRKSGGEAYARTCALAFRQCLAAHKLVADTNGNPLYFSKENFSNGCIATVDITYPSAPFFLLYNPDLLQAQLDPVLAYAESPRWKFPFAPHDLGAYPLANGQVYGGGEHSEKNQMPVEECGNMLILVCALCLRTQRNDYARRWWKLLSGWAQYLLDQGMNPDSQLCTDDFAGHLAGNANLSLKAIIALGSYAKLAAQIDQHAESERISAATRQMTTQWLELADDGSHYRLAFDQAGSWSQKYNLVWDRLLGLHLFPPEVIHKELASYRKRLNRYGLPLDSRKTYTKLDWTFWTAALSGNDDDFHTLTAPALRWVSESSSRIPLTDWYETVDQGECVGFRARSVVGGIFIRLLEAID